MRDQYVRDLTRDVKLKMQERGLNLVGEYMYCILTVVVENGIEP